MEKDYVIPLRAVLTAPWTRRTPRAIKVIRQFLERHMKSDEIVIGKSLNEHVWENSISNPPKRVKVHVLKDKENVVYVELPGVKIVTRAEREKAEEDKKEARENEKKEKEKLKAAEEATKTKEEKKAEALDHKVTEVK